jgi:hypothetical protein
MNEAAAVLLKHSDFTSFSRLARRQQDKHLQGDACATGTDEAGKAHLHCTADRFLRNMVRAVVGTLIPAGRGQAGSERFRRNSAMEKPGTCRTVGTGTRAFTDGNWISRQYIHLIFRCLQQPTGRLPAAQGITGIRLRFVTPHHSISSRPARPE